jgi:hypothetical protein
MVSTEKRGGTEQKRVEQWQTAAGNTWPTIFFFLGCFFSDLFSFAAQANSFHTMSAEASEWLAMPEQAKQYAMYIYP